MHRHTQPVQCPTALPLMAWPCRVQNHHYRSGGEQLVPLPAGGGSWDTPRMEARSSAVQGPVGSATTTATQTHIPSIAGVYVEATGKTLSLSDASREHLLQPDLAWALLEAQAATGGIVDPVRKQLVSVAKALGMGLAGLEMKEGLLCAERAVTGFPDPYSQERISLYQALQKELVGREQGLRLLEAQIATGGILEPSTGRRVPLPEAYAQGYLDEDLGNILSDPEKEEAKGFLDPNSNQKVSYSELMRRCIMSPGTGLLLLPLKISFPGLRGTVCSHELLDSGILDSATFKALHDGELTTQEVAETDAVQQYLSGTNSIAGVAILQTGESRSLYQAMSEHILMPGTAEILLQAQAATGGLIDPIRSKSFTADEAVQAGVVGPELYEKLSLAEKAVTGYKDPYTGETLSLFQAMGKGLVPRDSGMFLLEAQLATGGIIDPHTHHRLPVEVACQRGHLDKGTHRLLCSPTDDTRGFSEPNSKQNLSYKELLSRCVADPDTGLFLLPLSGNPGKEHPFIDQRTQCVLKSTTVPKPCGQLKGQPVSLWKLLFSHYMPREQCRALTQQFNSGSLSTQELADRVTHLVHQGSVNSRVTFEGLRDKVTPAQLLSSEIISKDVFEKLTHGETLAQEVLGVGAVKRYLEGTGSIAGLLLPDSQEKISIYRAKRQGLLRPGTSLILLEAQAATGYIIDPTANKKYTVDEALRANVIGPEVYDKLLAAEKAVTGYKDPYTGSKISLFQAMKKDLIVKEHAIRLLEAQIATGGIIDPVNSHRLPVEAAYKRGYFDRKMNLILSDPSDDTKGFFDPNTHENLSYLQLKEKCLTEPSTGLCLLPLNSRKRLLLIDDTTKEAFRSSWLSVKYGRFQGQRVSVWALLNSEYFSEGKRREILNHYSLRTITLQQIRLLLEEEMKKWARITFPAVRGRVTAHHLMETGIINRDLFEKLLEGAVSPEEVMHMDSVRRYLYGTGSIGGIVLQPSHQRVSLYEAMKRNIVGPGVALPLLEAQAATGFLIDPVNNQKLGLEEAVRGGVVGPELYEKLRRAEEAVTGYQDPFTGKKISLFQALKKGLVADQQALQLLDAQLSTGGVMDPHSGHYVPVEFAQKKGYLDEAIHAALSNPSSDTKAFRAPDQKEKVTYGQLIHQCEKDEASGIHLLPLSEAASPVYTDEQVEQCFRETLLEDRGTSLWDLLSSGYFTVEQRREFLEKFRSGSISLQQLVSYVQGLVKDFEMKAETQVTLRGLRGEVPTVWLLDTGIISEETFAELAQGRRTAKEVSEMASVKKYLRGTGSIAGVFLQDSKEKLGLYQAMQNGFLLPGTGTRLLEAQAATGSIIDPATNRTVGAEEAVKVGLVGEELTGQLLQAERALTGYPDPYSGKPLSVCQAIRKELIPAHVGIPLLEAQLATGGVVDPLHHHHLPLQAAYKHGFYDKDMHKALSQPSDETCVFLDPNTQESLTYQQLKDRCLQDPATGLLLLPLSKDAAFYGDRHTVEALKYVTVCVNAGRFKGQEVSLWDLLNSEYVTKTQRRELLLTYQAKKAEALQEMMAALTQIMEETEQQGRRFAFKGLRKQVSATDLFQSQLIDKGILDDLRQGKKTVQDITKMESVRQYLEGSNFIAGVLLQPNRERMSIYQAMRQGLLRPGAALVLLEAQAATGFLLDPVGNKRLSVDEAVAAGLVGREVYEKLLSAEKAVTGYMHPYTKRKISLFEAMKEELIVKSHGVRLLEAQVATGGIIDPVHSHRIPVEVAYKRGYFDEELNQTLVDPSYDTKGFFDPNTHENLTYLQLLERCVQDPETGLYMLQIVRRGGRYFYIDEATKQFLKAQPLQMHVGRYRGQAVSMWDLLCSPYIQEQERKDLVSQYKGGGLTLEQLGRAICTVVEQIEQQAQAFQLKGPRGKVSAADLFNAEIIDRKTLDGLHQGPGALQQLAQEASVRRFLEGTGCIAGVLAKGQKMTVSRAMERGLLSPEHGLMLLEAQAATGFLTDPTEKKTFSVDQAVSSRLVGEDVQTKLRLAEKAVTGYTDPTTGEKVSLYQAMKRNILGKELALRLLEAQMATGGVMDPFYGHRIPVEVAYKRGHLDDGTFLWLSDADYSHKGFVDPNTQERITYAQLLERCVKDADSGMYLLPLLDKTEYFYVDEVTKNILSSTKINVTHGKFRGQMVSLWELLSSDYINEEKRKDLIQKYKQGPSAVLQHIVNEVLNKVKEKEQAQREVWFQGLRKQVTASELLKAEIISRDTMKDLEEGKQTAQHVATRDSVRRYLEGTGSIAGVLVPATADPAKMEKMTIYQAMWKGILRPGTALVLLEAQAATGFMIDPLKNAKLSVREAISAGVVGGEIQNKLRSAEKAVTGYTDPNNGENISLFQAMKKGLILKEHGIRLLEAQVATGGVIDPVHSHRLPVEVAYRRGFFDEDMNRTLSDPTDNNKGFFDPNTHENLTYKQLLSRCLPDPETGLLMLHVMDRGSSSFLLNEQARTALQSARVQMEVGLFQGQGISVWDLLFSRYIPPQRREALLRQYKTGTLTLEGLTQILTATILEAEESRPQPSGPQGAPAAQGGPPPTGDLGQAHQEEEAWQEALRATTLSMPTGEHQGHPVLLWELLFSDYITEEKRRELLDLYRRGLLPMDRLITVLTTLVQKKEATARKLEVRVKGPGSEEVVRGERGPGVSSPDEGSWESPLRAQRISVSLPEFQGQDLSVWDLLFSQRFSPSQREELLSKYRTGHVTLEELMDLLATFLAKGATRGRRHPTAPEAGTPNNEASLGADPGEKGEEMEERETVALGGKEQALKSRLVKVAAGEFHGQKVSVWDLLHSKYIPKEKRKELLQLYRSGILTTDQMETVVTTIVNRTEEEESTQEASHAEADSWEDPLRRHMVVLHVGPLQGQEVSLWDLLFSQDVPEGQREELLRKYRSGALSLQEMVGALAPLLSEGESRRGKGVEGTPTAENGPSLSTTEHPLEAALRQVPVEVPVGEFQGHRCSLWELLFSKYVSAEKRHELLEMHRAGSASTEQLVRSVVALIEEMEAKSSQLKFSGLRRQVTASELFSAQIIDQDTLSKLTQGTKSVEEITEMDSVRRYLKGTSCIAGVLVPARADPTKTEKMTIYQAMWKGILRPGTALVLLEAQAATGFITDPLRNRKLSVDEAVAAEVVGAELREKLLSAERAVTGYKDPYTGSSLSLFQAMKKGLIVKDHGIRLLEAQVATGGVIDPVHSHRLPVEVAYRRGFFDEDMNRTLSDPTDDNKGFFDPNTHENLTYKQLLSRCLPDPETGLLMLHVMDRGSSSFLLNEQARTALQSARVRMEVGLFQGQGVSVWDLLFSRYIPPQRREALLRQYKTGTLTLEGLNQIITATVLEAEESRPQPSGPQGAPAAQGAPLPTGDLGQAHQEEEAWQEALRATTLSMPTGEHQGHPVLLWELLFSDYITEEKRRELLDLYRRGLLPMDRLITVLTTLVQKKEATARKLEVRVKGLGSEEVVRGERGPGVSSPDEGSWESSLRAQRINVSLPEFQGQDLSVWDLLFSQRFSPSQREELVSKYRTGRVTLEELMDLLATFLAKGATRGRRHLTAPEAGTPDNEASLGADPGEEMEERETVALGGKEQALKSRLVKVAAGEFHGQKVSVWDLLHSKYIPKEKRKELLQLYRSGILTTDQMETVVTTIVNRTEEEESTQEASHAEADSWEDPLRCHMVVLQVGPLQDQEVSLWDILFSQDVPEGQREELLRKYRSGALSLQEMVGALAPLLSEGESRCGKGAEGTPTAENGPSLSTTEHPLEAALRQVPVEVPVGEFQGHRCSLWELLFSKYVSAEKRHELLEMHRAGSASTEQLVRSVVALIEEMEAKSSQLKFSGLRRQVTASELFSAQIIDQDTLSKLTQGTKSVEEITEMDSVRRYLEGTSCIAGVLVPARADPTKTEKMTIYQAMWKGILRPGTALVLLEAQAATGFITDPLRNRKLSVDEAVAAEVVGAELREKLLSAERAVTGYKDPYTGSSLSLFQAMKKGLIVKDHGIRLLEAQVATGGVIDPVHSHRLPVEVAYRRGFFDEDMNRTLSDPTDDNKGFFDPNTHENLTYKQLLSRCLPDPETGLLMLHVMDRGSSSFLLNEQARTALQSARVRMEVGLFQGQGVSVWDLLFSRYIPPQRREALLRQYKTGTLTLEGLTQIITATVLEAEESRPQPSGPQGAPAAQGAPLPTGDLGQAHQEEEAWQEALRATTLSMPAGEHQGHPVLVWELLFSDYITEDKRRELLDLYRRGLLPMDRLITVLTTLVQKKEATARKLEVRVKGLGSEEVVRGERGPGVSSPDEGSWESPLRAQRINVSLPEFQGQDLSVWDLLFSQRFSPSQREELLSKYRTGRVTLEELMDLLATFLAKGATRGRRHPTAPEAGTPDNEASLGADPGEEGEEMEERETVALGGKEQALKSRLVEVAAGEFHGQKVSVWDLLHSKYIPKEKRKELLQLYRSGILTTDQMETVVTTIVNRTEEGESTQEASHAEADSWEDPLRRHMVVLHVGPLQGQEVSLWDLLFSQDVPEGQREELLRKYRSGALSLQEMVGALAPLLSEGESRRGKGAEGTPKAENGPSLSTTEHPLEAALRQVPVEVPVGEFQGHRCSLWELLFSKYVSAEKRHELLEMHRAGSASTEQLVRSVVALIEEMEAKSSQLKFSGLRRQVTASELFSAQIIDQDTLSKLTQGTKSVEEITEMDSVRRYLEGTSCIAGVLVPTRADPTKTEKMTIYQAMWKGILRPGTALVLLEAQAATGFITDPLRNRKLSVDEAVAAEVVGAELREKLLSAERAVTGYKDPYTGSSLSLFQAMKKGLIVKDHGIRLLEAQVATGGVIDPVHSHRLPVEVAYRRGFFDEDMNRTLSDPTDDNKGFFDPNTHENLTYKQLLSRSLPDPETGLLMLHVMDRGSSSFLLNEQARTALQSARVRMEVGLFQGQGVSVWDLLFSRYIPPQRREALLRQYKTGTLTLEGLTQIITATVLEAEESRPQPSGPQGAPAAQGAPLPTGDLGQAHQEEEAWQEALRATTLSMPAGEHQGHPVLVWELLFSDYITEDKRRELLDLYRRGLLPMDRLITVLTTLVQKKEVTARKLEVRVKGLGSEEVVRGERGPGVSSPDEGSWESPLRAQRINVSLPEFQGQDLSVWDLLFSQRFSPSQREELLSKYRTGRVTLEELMDLLATFLAKGATRGRRHPTAPEAGTPDNEASLGADPGEEGEEMEEREMVALGGKEQALKSRLVEVAAGEFHGQKVSVWDLLHSKYIPKEKRKELLQLYRSGILTTDQMETVVTTIVNRTEEEESTQEASHAEADSWEDPLRRHMVVLHVGPLQGQEVSLWDLLFSQDVPEGQREELLRKYRSGALSLQEMVGALAPLLSEGESRRGKGAEGTPKAENGPSLSTTEHPLEAALRQVPVEVPVGEFQGHRCSLWELLFSKYISAEKRHELLEMHRAGSASTEQLVRSVIALIEEMEAKSSQLKFSGLRRQVTASELFSAQIIDQDTLSKLMQGTKSVEEITEMDSVRRYLEGTSCIAGVLVPTRADPTKTEKMTIYQAMWKGILRPGTALVLLEAQAATGFITDPLRNRKLSVDEAVAAEVVGAELREKLLSAERAVTGYKDPYTGSSLSLFQAMKKGLIVKDHGIRLLEAQVATGGVIDPVHSHRLPVEVAYRRGFFDEDMNQTLSDPTDDNKGFFDPNTHENLTYKQLLSRSLPDPETGLLMLHVMDRGSSSFLLNEQARTALQSARVRMEVGLFQGQGVSVWDLLFSRYIPPQRREALLRQYKTGTLTLEGLTQILTATVLEAEESRPQPSGPQGAPAAQGAPPPTGDLGQAHQEEEAWQEALRATTLSMPAGEHQGHPVLVWELLFSDYITEDKRRELLDLYRRGLLPMDRLITVLTTLVQKKEATARKLEVRVKGLGSEEVVRGERGPGVSSPDEGSWESSLRAQRINVSLPEFQGQDLSVWDLLFSQRFSPSQREELLSKYRTGRVTLEELMDLLATFLAKGATRGCRHPTAPEAGTPDNEASLGADPGEEGEEMEERETVALGGKEQALKSRLVKVAAGEFHGQKVSVWDLLHSKYIPKEKRKELLQLYRSGILTTDQMETVVTTIVNRTEEEESTQEASHAEADSWEDPLHRHMVVLHVGPLQGQEVSLWDLLFSQYISETKREELLYIFRDCHLTPEELAAILSTLISQLVDENTELSADCIMTSPEASVDKEEDFAFSKAREKEMTPISKRVETPIVEAPRTKFSVWDFLHSQQIPEEKQRELLRLHQLGTLTPDQIETLVTSPGSQAEGQQEHPSSDTVLPGEAAASPSSHYDLLQRILHQEKIDVTIREVHGERASVWDPFFSRCVSHITKEEILHRQGSPTVSVKENIRSITTLIADAESPSRGPISTGEVPKEDLTSTGTSVSFQKEEDALKSRRVDSSVDGFHGQQDSLWDLLHSHYILEEKRNELLHLFKSGKLTLDQVQTEVTTTIKKTVNKGAKQASHEDLPPGHCKETLQKHTMQFQGQEVSLWDLLFSQDISKSQQEDLLAKYRNGRVTPEELRHTLAALLVDPTTRQCQYLTTPGTAKLDVAAAAAAAAAAFEKEEDEEKKEMVALGDKEEALKSRLVKVMAGEFHGQRVSVWDLLHSKYIPKEKRKELLQLYRSGILTTDQMETVVTTIVNRTEEEEKASELSYVESPMQEVGSSGKCQPSHLPGSISLEETLRSETFMVPVGDLQGQKVSCWELLSSKSIPEEKKQELLSQFKAEVLSPRDLAVRLSNLLPEAGMQARGHSVSRGDGCQAKESRGEASEDSRTRQLQLKQSLRTTLVPVAVGEYKGKEVCVLDLLFSKYVPQDKRQELLELYRAGTLPVHAMVTTLTTLIEEAERKGGKSGKKKKMSCMKGTLCWKDRGDHP